jgi:hypothetical protein
MKLLIMQFSLFSYFVLLGFVSSPQHIILIYVNSVRLGFISLLLVSVVNLFTRMGPRPNFPALLEIGARGG